MGSKLPLLVFVSLAFADGAHAAALMREGEGRVAVQALVETACSVAVDQPRAAAPRQTSASDKPAATSPVRVTCSDASGFALSLNEEGDDTDTQVRTAADTAHRQPRRRFFTVTY